MPTRSPSLTDPLASPEDPFLTVPEVAAQLRYTEVTIRNWIRNGKLRAIRARNRGYRIRTSDLEAMINNIDGSTTAPPVPAPATAADLETETPLLAHIRIGNER